MDKDLISRSVAIKEIYNCQFSEKNDQIMTVTVLENLPVSELPRNGRWVKEEDRRNHWHCSECGFVEGAHVIACEYCPRCGVKLGAVKLEELD